MNHIDRVALATLAVWVGLCGVLTLTILETESPRRALLLASVIIGLAAATAHLAILVRRLPGPRWRRWLLICLTVGACALVSHAVFVHLGMRQSLMQDLVNLGVVTGIALVVQEGIAGHRARTQLQHQSKLLEEMEARVRGLSARQGRMVVVKIGHSERRIDPSEVSHAEADGNFVRLWLGPEYLFVSESLKDIVEQLSEHSFVRIHKSCAVNAAWVQERRGDDIVLRTGQRLRIGRAYLNSVRDLLFDDGRRPGNPEDPPPPLIQRLGGRSP
jgi:hypothetical protein